MSGNKTHLRKKTYVCATAQTGNLDQAGFEALTWVEIGNLISTGAFSTEQSIVDQQLQNGDTFRQKGYDTPTQPEISYIPDFSDAGQDTLRTIAATDFFYAFKVEKEDKLAAAGNNSAEYAIGVVTEPMEVEGTGEDYVTHSVKLGLRYKPVKVEPTAS